MQILFLQNQLCLAVFIQRIQLLLIEDSASDARQICAMLSYAKFAKFNVVRAVTAAEGVECLETDDYDIILMDLALPDSEDLDAFYNVHALAGKTLRLLQTGNIQSYAFMFALGVTAYEVFCNMLPWDKAQSLQTLLSHMNSPNKNSSRQGSCCLS